MAIGIVRQSSGLDASGMAAVHVIALRYVARAHDFVARATISVTPSFDAHLAVLASVLPRTFCRQARKNHFVFPISQEEALSLGLRLPSNSSPRAWSADGFVAYRVDQVRYFFYSRLKASQRTAARRVGIALLAMFSAAVSMPASAAAEMCKGNLFNDAAAVYNLDPDLLRAITWVESRGRPGAVGPKLADGHRAWGAAQINDIHLPELVSYGVTQRDLLDPCVNLKLSAWVLANCIRAKGATWAAVGCYNAGPGSTNVNAQARYVRLVQHAYEGYRAQSAAALASSRGAK